MQFLPHRQILEIFAQDMDLFCLIARIAEADWPTGTPGNFPVRPLPQVNFFNVLFKARHRTNNDNSNPSANQTVLHIIQ